MRLEYFLVGLGMLYGMSAYAQRVDCAESLNAARSHFDNGHLYVIPSTLKPCLDNGFSKDQRIEAYLLLARTYLLIDDPISAEDSYLKLLGEDPEYELDKENDPVDIVYLDSKFTTTPIFILFAKAGLNTTNAATIQNYGVDNTDFTLESYSNRIGFTLGGGTELNLSDHLSLGLEVNFLNRRHEYRNVLFGGDNLTFVERENAFEVPIFLKYRTKIRSFYPFVYGGASASILLNATAEVEFIDKTFTSDGESEVSVTGPDIDLAELRNSINYNVFAGIGTSYRIGYNYVFVDFRFVYGLNNIVDVANQYNNSELLYRYAYVDDLKRLQSLMVNFGIIKPIYKPRKIVKKKGLFKKIFN